MDIISFNEAATANSRIEKFIENPDSTSGVVTVPKVIASGETITIPAGRVAILPNVQIDGVLNVENGGEVFIPSGATLSSVVEKVTSTDNAIVRFDGTTGKVQDSKVVVNDSGYISVNSSSSGEHTLKPNTTSEYVRFSIAASDYSSLPSWRSTSIIQYGSTATGNYVVGSIPNASLGLLWSQNINNMIIGNNSNAPIIFANSSIERMRIDTAGNVLVTGSGGLGYGAGSGGTVTQLTSKSTAVTLNKPTGFIGMSIGSLAAGASVTFTFNNSLLSGADTLNIVIFSDSIATQGSYRLTWSIKLSLAYITLTNQSASALNEGPLLNFSIIKGAIS